MEKLEKVQKRAVNMVAGLKGKTYQDKFKKVGLTTLEERRDRGDMIQTFRIIQGLDNVEVGTLFQMAGDRAREGAVNTRHSRDTTRLVEGDSQYENRRNFFSQPKGPSQVELTARVNKAAGNSSGLQISL